MFLFPIGASIDAEANVHQDNKNISTINAP